MSTSPEHSPPEDAGHACDESGPRFGVTGRPFAKTPFHQGLYGGLGVAVAYLLYLSLEIVLPLLIVIVVAGFLAIGLNPLVIKIQRWGASRGLAVAIVCLGAFLVMCGGLFSLVPPIITEGTDFINNVPGYIESLSHQKWLLSLDKQFGLLDQLQAAAEGIDAGSVLSAAGGVASVLGVAIGSVFDGIMLAILTIYFLAAFDRLRNGFYRLLPAPRRERARALGDEILVKVGSFTVGALTIAATAGASSFVFMLIAGVPYAYALAFVVAILDLVPQIGATLGAILVTLVGLTESVWVALACAIFFIIYQQVENWIIYPTVMRRSVKVSDLAAILGLLLGASLLGVVGALLAVPTVAAIQLIVREVYIPRQDIA
jgi:predicted PurR-regulated permease PerM